MNKRAFIVIASLVVLIGVCVWLLKSTNPATLDRQPTQIELSDTYEK